MMDEEAIKARIYQWRALDTSTRLPNALIDDLPAVVVNYMIDHDLLTVEEQNALMQWVLRQQKKGPPA